MKKEILKPSIDEIKSLSSKFRFDIEEYGTDGFVKYLCDYLLCDNDLIAITPNPSDESFYIVKKQAYYAGYLGCTLFFKTNDIIDIIYCAIGIHIIFDLQFPERIENLAAFLLKYFKNYEILGPKAKKKPLPNIVTRKLSKEGMEF